jgi:hypothetical protein
MSGWIPADDRQPDDQAWVLGVAAHSRGHVIANWHPLSGWSDRAGYGIDLAFWRPLPPLPEAPAGGALAALADDLRREMGESFARHGPAYRHFGGDRPLDAFGESP